MGQRKSSLEGLEGLSVPTPEQLRQFAIYIPAYNAALTLPRVFARLPEHVKRQVAEILVVDNASVDDTSLVTIRIKEQESLLNLNLVRNNKNEGYGGSQKIAYQHCIDKNHLGVVMLHGDAQYAPELIETLLKPIAEGKADMVFGSRFTGDPLKGGMPFHRYLGNRFLTTIQNLLLGTKLSEFHSGYRVYSVEALKKIPFQRFSSDYHFDTEIIIALADRKQRIVEMPIPTHYGDEENYVNIWKYGLDVLVTTVTYFLHRRGIRRSRNWSKIFGDAGNGAPSAADPEKKPATHG
jgi:glycosyltransferase involved in cell wall biosynthesis